jgi:cell division protein FtsW (lipid II flippase)
MITMKTRELKIRYDYWLELIVLTLMAMGTVFVFSAGASVAGQYDWKRFLSWITAGSVLPPKIRLSPLRRI